MAGALHNGRLGLALVRGLVEMHGGSVCVASEGLGKGAEFTVRFPLEAGAPRAKPAAGAVTGDGVWRRVLVIEDNIDAAESLRDVLELDQHTVEVAFSGADGLDKARAFKPELVLCDIGLPGMDGYEVARRMRADAQLRGATLVALTGYAAPEDIIRCTQAGFDSHLAKPPDIAALQRLLSGIANG